MAFAQSRAFPKLEVLDLSHNQLGLEGLKALVHSPIMAQLKVLNLSQNGLGVAGRDRLQREFPHIKIVA